VIDPAVNWSGFYVGVNGGWEQARTSWVSFGSSATNITTTSGGGTAGGQVGVLGQWGSFVAGAEVSYNGLFGPSAMNTTVPFVVAFNGQSKVEDLLLVTTKVGWTANRNLFYVKGGYANGEVKLNEVLGPPAFAGFVTGGVTSGRASGWTAGLGWEYMFAQAWSAGIEYDYARLDVGQRLYTPVNGFGCPFPACGVRDGTVELNSITARLNYHFNWAQPVVAKY
jgi:outer membrane immunogenic protein